MDIHNNDFNKIVDDCIEVDGIVSNARVYANRGLNGRMGVSIAPVLGGPTYIFRNVFYNMETSIFKMNRAPSGLVIVHNTGLKVGNACSSTPGWQNTYMANNILCGTRYCFEEYGLVDNSHDDWDYNAYYSSRELGTAPWFKWNDVRYDNIDALFMGANIEEFGIQIDLSTFVNATLPEDYTIAYNIADVDLDLSSNSTCINSGKSLPNLNDPFVSDGLPDRGAIEFGAEPISYGPDFDFTNLINEKVVHEELMLVSPNPAKDYLFVYIETAYAFLQIIDIEGRVISELNQSLIDISDLAVGTYIIRAVDKKGNMIAQEKFVKVGL